LRSYTEQELKEPFIIYSTKIDHAAMQKDFGKKIRDNLLLAQIGQSLGLATEVVTTLTATIDEDGEAVEAEIVEITDPFLTSATTDTLNDLEELFMSVEKKPHLRHLMRANALSCVATSKGSSKT
jgi:hypothetical protein